MTALMALIAASNGSHTPSNSFAELRRHGTALCIGYQSRSHSFSAGNAFSRRRKSPTSHRNPCRLQCRLFQYTSYRRTLLLSEDSAETICFLTLAPYLGRKEPLFRNSKASVQQGLEEHIVLVRSTVDSIIGRME